MTRTFWRRNTRQRKLQLLEVEAIRNGLPRSVLLAEARCKVPVIPSSRASAGNERRRDRSWNSFVTHCESEAIDPLSISESNWEAHLRKHAERLTEKGERIRPSTVVAYASDIAHALFARGVPSPTWTSRHKSTIQAIWVADERPRRRARALYGDSARQVATSLARTTTTTGLRDETAAKLLFTRGSRSQEITGIMFRNVDTSDARGVLVKLHIAKRRRNCGLENMLVPYIDDTAFCAATAIVRWCNELGQEYDGPLFPAIDRWGHFSPKPMNPRSITYLLRKWLKDAGIPNPDTYSSHSPRHGVVTELTLRKCTPEQIMLITNHLDHRSLESYMTQIDPWFGFDKSKPVRDYVSLDDVDQ